MKNETPAFWASYLINDDPSGLDQADIDLCDNVTKDFGYCVAAFSDDDQTFFGQFKGIGCDLCEYTFRID